MVSREGYVFELLQMRTRNTRLLWMLVEPATPLPDLRLGAPARDPAIHRETTVISAALLEYWTEVAEPQVSDPDHVCAGCPCDNVRVTRFAVHTDPDYGRALRPS